MKIQKEHLNNFFNLVQNLPDHEVIFMVNEEIVRGDHFIWWGGKIHDISIEKYWINDDSDEGETIWGGGIY